MLAVSTAGRSKRSPQRIASSTSTPVGDHTSQRRPPLTSPCPLSSLLAQLCSLFLVPPGRPSTLASLPLTSSTPLVPVLVLPASGLHRYTCRDICCSISRNGSPTHSRGFEINLASPPAGLGTQTHAACLTRPSILRRPPGYTTMFQSPP